MEAPPKMPECVMRFPENASPVCRPSRSVSPLAGGTVWRGGQGRANCRVWRYGDKVQTFDKLTALRRKCCCNVRQQQQHSIHTYTRCDTYTWACSAAYNFTIWDPQQSFGFSTLSPHTEHKPMPHSDWFIKPDNDLTDDPRLLLAPQGVAICHVVRVLPAKML